MNISLHHVATFCHCIFLVVILTSCGITKKTLTERTVRVDSVTVQTVAESRDGTGRTYINDRGVFEDAHLRVEWERIPTPDSVKSADTEIGIMPDACYDSTGTEVTTSLSDWYQIDYTIKPETVRVQVPQKTITEKIETTVLKKEMPNWGWIVIGILGGFLLVILIGAKVMR